MQRELRVIGKDDSEKDRAEVQKTMLGPEVLDSEHHQEIVFKSTGAESAGQGQWTLRGNLDAARADAAGHGASNAEGRPLDRREQREADRFRDQASRKSGSQSQRRS